MSSSKGRRKKGSDAIAPTKPNEDVLMAETLYSQGLDIEKIMGKPGELPEGLKHLQQGGGAQSQEQQSDPEISDPNRGRSKEEMEELMKRLGVGEAAGKTYEDGDNDMSGMGGLPSGFPGMSGMQGGFPGMSGMQGGFSGMGGGFQGMGASMGTGAPSSGENEMSQAEIMNMFKGLDDLSDKDKEAALLAMGGPKLLQQYQQQIGPAIQNMKMQGGDMMEPDVGGTMGFPGNQLGGNGSSYVPGAGGMLGGGSGRGQQSGRGGRGRRRDNILGGGSRGGGPAMRGRMQGSGQSGLSGLGRGGFPGMGGGFPGMGGGGFPGMGGGGIPGMGGGGIPGMGGGGIPGVGGNSEMSQENIMQMFQQFQLLESMPANEKEEALMAMGGQEFVQMYHERIAPLMQQMGMGQGGMLNALAGGGGLGQGGAGGQTGGLSGLAGLLGGQGSGAGGMPGLGGLLGGQGSGAGGMPGLGGSMLGGQGSGAGGMPGLGGMFGGQGAEAGNLFGGGGQGGLGSLFNSRSGSNQGSRTRQKAAIDPNTLKGLETLSEEDRKAALEAMGNPDIGNCDNEDTTESFPPRPRHYEPPEQPHEPRGPGMLQFYRRQPMQLPIHSGGAESRREMDDLMPLSRRKKRFGERALVRTHGATIDLDSYHKHLVKTWSDEAIQCKDPMGNGPSTIMVLDVSESMRGEPLRQAVQAVELFIEALEENIENYGLEENLALLVWQGDTFKVTHLTNDYDKIRNVLDNLDEVIGSSPLIMTLAVIQGIAARAKVVKVQGHEILTRAIIFSDFIVTPPGFDTTQEEYVRERVQVSVDANFFENTQDLIHDHHVRLWTVPVGGEDTREWFANRICKDGFGEKVLPEDAKWLARNHICERILSECKARLPPLNPANPEDEPDEGRVKEIADTMFTDTDEDDIEFIIKRFKEKLERPPLTKRQQREKRLQQQIDRAEAIERGENPPPIPEDPNKKKKPEKKGRKSLEELLGIDSDEDDDEDDDEETDLLFRLPGLLGDEEDAENDPLTKQKIEELLEYYGGGPSKIDNLPIMPDIGTRVKIGPDWMWQKNDIPDGVHGTVIGIDQEEPGWVKVQWDPAPGTNQPGKEEDYRFGVDYEFDVEPVNGGMDAVKWPPGKERKIVEPIWLQELNREKEELAELRARIEKEKQKEQKEKEEKEKRKEKEEVKKEKKPGQESTTQTSDDSWSDLSSVTSESTIEGQVCFVWQYQDDDGTWKTYDTDTQAKLESTYVKRNGKGTVIIDFKGHNDRVVFEKMEQRRIDKHRRRQVRRIEADADQLKELQEMFSS